MTFVGALGVLLGMLAVSWGMVEKNNRKLGLLVGIAIIHVLTAALYYLYVQDNDADTKLYYFDPYKFYEKRFSLGTQAVIFLVQWLKDNIGGTYFDYFLVFQAIGFWGIVLLMRAMEELTLILNRPWHPILTLMFFMPGMYFWTSAIGKDAPLFFACTLAVWATLSLAERWLWFGVAMVVMLAFRPHVTLIAVISLAIAVISGRGVKPAARFILFAIMISSTAVLIRTIQNSLEVNLSSAGSIANYVEYQTETAATAAAAGGTLISQSFPAKVISLLFRPFFVDAGGLFGLIASLQNLFMVFAAFVLIRNFRIWRAMFRDSLTIRFATAFLIALMMMLSIMYYNVGLGLRQREMFTPPLYLIFAAIYLVTRKSASQAALTSQPLQMPTFSN